VRRRTNMGSLSSKADQNRSFPATVPVMLGCAIHIELHDEHVLARYAAAHNHMPQNARTSDVPYDGELGSMPEKTHERTVLSAMRTSPSVHHKQHQRGIQHNACHGSGCSVRQALETCMCCLGLCRRTVRGSTCSTHAQPLLVTQLLKVCMTQPAHESSIASHQYGTAVLSHCAIGLLLPHHKM